MWGRTPPFLLNLDSLIPWFKSLVRDPWPWWNYIRKKRKRPLFSKNALKIFPIQVYKFSFLITSNIYRFNSNWYWPCWKPLRARVGDCCLKSIKEKQIILYLQQLPKKTIQLTKALVHHYCEFFKTFESFQVEDSCANKKLIWLTQRHINVQSTFDEPCDVDCAFSKHTNLVLS